MNPNDYTRLKDPCVKYPIDDLELPFEKYISECRTLIKNNRLDLNQYPNPDAIIDANTPFELKPEPTSSKIKVGALLIHGLFDSPFVMRDIGFSLQKHGMLIRSVILPGHGTVPGGLLNVTYQEWVQTALYGINNLANDVDEIFLVGFSTGASLALHHVFGTMHPKIKGIILLAPAIEISPLGPLTGLMPKLHFLSERFNWLRIAPENDYTKYQSFTYNSAYQVYLLTQEIKRLSETHFLKCPVFVCISADDGTVISKATLHHFRNYSSKESRLLIYTNKPNDIHDTRIIKRPAAFSEWNICNISHVAIPISPDNPHYGKEGDFPGASFVGKNKLTGNKITYCASENFTHRCLNKLFHARLFPRSYSRLTFNPDFDFLTKSIERFIEKIKR